MSSTMRPVRSSAKGHSRRGGKSRLLASGFVLIGFASVLTLSVRADDQPYKIEIDPGVSCHMKPEEVADVVKDEKIVSMHCTILEAGKIGTPQRQTVWTVSLGDHGYTVDDATGKIIGHGGVGFPTMGVSPHPQPVQAPR